MAQTNDAIRRLATAICTAIGVDVEAVTAITLELVAGQLPRIAIQGAVYRAERIEELAAVVWQNADALEVAEVEGPDDGR